MSDSYENNVRNKKNRTFTIIKSYIYEKSAKFT